MNTTLRSGLNAESLPHEICKKYVRHILPAAVELNHTFNKEAKKNPQTAMHITHNGFRTETQGSTEKCPSIP